MFLWFHFYINLCVNVCVYVQRSNGMRCIRLHIPWLILSREAELQKIKVAVKKVGSFIYTFWSLIFSFHVTDFFLTLQNMFRMRSSYVRKL